MALPKPLIDAIALEMTDLADHLCALACTLVTDTAVVERHFDALQSIDLLTQIQRALVDALQGAGSVEEKLARIPVEALAERMSDAVETFAQAA